MPRYRHHAFDFDSTLGFPGDSLVIWVAVCSVAPYFTSSPIGLPQNRGNRAKLLEAVNHWLQTRGSSLGDLLKLPVDQAEHTAVVLVEYGQMLFRSGFPGDHWAIHGTSPLKSRQYT